MTTDESDEGPAAQTKTWSHNVDGESSDSRSAAHGATARAEARVRAESTATGRVILTVIETESASESRTGITHSLTQ
jgi:hypothetical protein